jgi:effector-binding domain-containing protein
MNGNDIHTIFEHLKTVFIFNIITDDKHVLSNSIKYTYQIKIGEGDEEKKKIKTKTSSLSNNYIEFYFKNNFQNLLPAIKKIVDWLNEA